MTTDRPRCTAITGAGTQCQSRARPNTDPPTCARHDPRPDTLPRRKRDARREAFLKAFAVIGTVSAAAEAAGVDRSTHYEWLNDPEYAADFEQAAQAAADLLEREAVRRAVQGTTRGVYHQGQKVGEETHYSDTLLMFLLNGRRPEVFRRERTIMAGAGFDAQGRPYAAVVDEHGEALAEAFSAYRGALEADAPIDVDSRER